MSITTRVAQLIQLFEDDPALTLLRGQNAPVAAAILGEYLSQEERVLPTDALREMADADLEHLRAAGHMLPATAQQYVTQWRTAGILIRRPTEEAHGETVELSSGALAALRFLEGREAPRKSATESRLGSLARQLRSLAIDTDPSAQGRLARLEEEKARIDAQISAITSGYDEPLANDRAEERLLDLLDQAAQVPDDFARIRAEFETLNSTLREKIIESDASQQVVLDDIFRGVDLIAESPEGQTFRAFTDLLLDPALSGAFEDDVDDVLDREFSKRMPPAQRRALREFVMTLKSRTAEVQRVMTAFARDLRRYVQSQDYLQDRVLRGLLQEALQAALAAAEKVKPYEEIGVDLHLTRVSLSSLGSLKLHDPSEFDAAEPLVIHETAVADLEALREVARATEIDFAELIDNVNEVLGERDEATVGQILAAHPATQGLASIVGLLTLAAERGIVDPDVLEDLWWEGVDGAERGTTVACHRFVGRLA